jgi:putative transposase
MSYVRIWVHCVWGTKNRIRHFNKEMRPLITDHIKGYAKIKDIYIDKVSCVDEHVHCLISLNPDQSIAGVMQLIKGETSFWINKNKLTANRFEWADEYFADSVSDSHKDKVRDYILNQEIHHRNKTWQEEYEEFIELYGFQRVKG